MQQTADFRSDDALPVCKRKSLSSYLLQLEHGVDDEDGVEPNYNDYGWYQYWLQKSRYNPKYFENDHCLLPLALVLRGRLHI